MTTIHPQDEQDDRVAANGSAAAFSESGTVGLTKRELIAAIALAALSDDYSGDRTLAAVDLADALLYSLDQGAATTLEQGLSDLGGAS